MDQVDEFVLLDNVQFERHSWQHRNRIKGSQGEIVLVVPVKRSGLETRLDDAVLADRRSVTKHLKSIEQAYARAPRRDLVVDGIRSLLTDPPERLVDLTTGAIGVLRNLLGVGTSMRLASSMEVKGQKDELVLSICEALSADRYLSAAGSRSYIETGHALRSSSVEVRYHDFECRTYPQLHGPFLSHLSAVDALMCLGDQGARDVMIAGRQPPTA